jgi:ubiquitin-conjugating enzyme E2 Z
VQFPEDYPSSAPQIVFLTTNGGKTRFNPNLYADGKVCLSILGTWRGESGEQWSSVQNCQSVMVSIQSLMDDKPYHNEPGFEKVRASL